MVLKANVNSPKVRIGAPTYGILLNAKWVSAAPSSAEIAGSAIILLTTTNPVNAHITTVSQNVPVEETNACRTGFRVWAAAATIGAEPNPDSLENNPLAIPKRAATIITVPVAPPPAAFNEKAS